MMHRVPACLVVLFLLAGCINTTQTTGHVAGEYLFEKDHTRVMFSVSHLGYSNMPGMFHKYEGTFSFNPGDIESAQVEMILSANSIDMFHEELNAHLRGTDFFNVNKYPNIRFISTSVERTGDNTSRLNGNLTLLGQTRPLSFDVTFNRAGPHPHPLVNKYIAGFSAKATLDRTQFGMNYGAPAIGKHIDIHVEVEGERLQRR